MGENSTTSKLSSKPRIAISAWGETRPNRLQTQIKVIFSELSKTFSVVEPGDSPDYFLSIEHDKKTLIDVQEQVSRKNRCLVVYEPKSVNPRQYSKRTTLQYGHHLQPSTDFQLSSLAKTFGNGGLTSPSQTNHYLMEAWPRQRDLQSICLVNANKFSAVKGSLYALRHDVIKAFTDRQITFSLAGAGWDASIISQTFSQIRVLVNQFIAGSGITLSNFRLPIRRKQHLNYVGTVEDSVEFQSHFAVAVVIENEPTYVSEKLFNSLLAGCAVIYCGPELSDHGIPDGICIQVPPKPESILNAYLALLDEPDRLEELRIHSFKWLIDQETRLRWGHSESFLRLARLIHDSLIGSPTD